MTTLTRPANGQDPGAHGRICLRLRFLAAVMPVGQISGGVVIADFDW